MVKAKSWRGIPKDKWENLKKLLLSCGGKEDKEVKGIKEVWRIRIDKTVFTMYETGTLFSTAPTCDEAVKAHREISNFLGEAVEKPEKKFLIGLDETGKGEVLGHSILAGVVFPSNLLEEIEDLIGLADTKKKRTVSYWDSLFICLLYTSPSPRDRG